MRVLAQERAPCGLLGVVRWAWSCGTRCGVWENWGDRGEAAQRGVLFEGRDHNFV